MTFLNTGSTSPSKLIGKRFTVRLLGQEEYRGVKEENATLLDVDSGLFQFKFDRTDEEIWVPLTQITSLIELVGG